MLRFLNVASVFAGALFLGTWLGATPQIARAHADALTAVMGPTAVSMSEAAPPPNDPKKKKEGEECKSKDECQSHHTCEKVDGKNVCKAPPRPRLPPGAVT